MVEFGIETFSNNAIRRASSCAFWVPAKLSLSQIEMHIGRIAMSAILAQRRAEQSRRSIEGFLRCKHAGGQP
jgi:hypothetical protein